MSTHLYLICREHDVSSDEVGNASFKSTLKEVREAIAQRKGFRDVYLKAQEMFELDYSDIHYIPSKRSCFTFLIKHADCDIEMRDEYGKYYDITEEPEECYAVLQITDRPRPDIDMTVGTRFPCQRDQSDGHQLHIHEGTDDRGVEFKVTWHAWKGKDD